MKPDRKDLKEKNKQSKCALLLCSIVIIITAIMLFTIPNTLGWRFKNGIIHSATQIDNSMCFPKRGIKISGMVFDVIQGQTLHTNDQKFIVFCSALFPSTNFFDDGYRAEKFKKIFEVYNFTDAQLINKSQRQGYGTFAKSICPECSYEMRKYWEQKIPGTNLTHPYIEGTKNEVKGFFISYWQRNEGYLEYIKNKHPLVANRFGPIDDENLVIAYPFLYRSVFIRFDPEAKKDIEQRVGEEIEIFQDYFSDKSGQFIQFIVGKKTKKVLSITCIINIGEENKPESASNNIKNSEYFLDNCTKFLRAETENSHEIRDTIASKPAVFIRIRP